jgi:U32 family peptidase
MKKYFRILAPFSRVEDVKLLKDAGADELYCGYVTQELTKNWPLAFNTLNRRGEDQSFEDYATFKKATELANQHNLPVYVTINGLYTCEQYPLLLELVEEVGRLEGVKGIIVADLGFLLTLKKNNFKKEIHISTGCTCFNSNTVDFFSNLGAKRIILDRQLASYEIESIFKEIKTAIDIEIFVIAQGCGGFIDGYCTFFHCFEKLKEEKIKNGVFLCSTYNLEQESKGCDFYFSKITERKFKVFSASTYEEKEIAIKIKEKKNKLYGCRICDLYDLKKYPIKSLKIVGRGIDQKYIAKLVNFIAKALFWLTCDNMSKREYQRKCKVLFSEIVYNNKAKCTKFDCYFSSYWLNNEKKN